MFIGVSVLGWVAIVYGVLFLMLFISSVLSERVRRVLNKPFETEKSSWGDCYEDD